MAEKDTQKAIIEYLQYKQIFCWKQHNVGVYIKKQDAYMKIGMKGVSDILGILPDGKFLAIEVKDIKGKLSEHQVLFLKNINDNNGVGFMAKSIYEVINKLKELNY